MCIISIILFPGWASMAPKQVVQVIVAAAIIVHYKICSSEVTRCISNDGLETKFCTHDPVFKYFLADQ